MQIFQKIFALEPSVPMTSPALIEITRELENSVKYELEGIKRELLLEASGFMTPETTLRCFQIPPFTSVLFEPESVLSRNLIQRRYSGFIVLIFGTDYEDYLNQFSPIKFKLTPNFWLDYDLKTGKIDTHDPVVDPRGNLI